jgi:hypothetical protein
MIFATSSGVPITRRLAQGTRPGGGHPLTKMAFLLFLCYSSRLHRCNFSQTRNAPLIVALSDRAYPQPPTRSPGEPQAVAKQPGLGG